MNDSILTGPIDVFYCKMANYFYSTSLLQLMTLFAVY